MSTASSLGWFWLGAGWISLGAGMLGVLLPLLPTTPLVLLAAWCFSRGSRRWHAYLLNHCRFGAIIGDWQAHGVIRLRAKWSATVLLAATFGLTAAAAGFPTGYAVLGRTGLALLAGAILAFIWSRPSRSSRQNLAPGETGGEP